MVGDWFPENPGRCEIGTLERVSKLAELMVRRRGQGPSLRHTFASRLAFRGIPMHAIGDLLGQNVATTTARYMHLLPEQLKQAMAALDGPPGDLRGSHMAAKSDEGA